MKKLFKVLIFSIIVSMSVVAFNHPALKSNAQAGTGNGLLGIYFNNLNFVNNILTKTDSTINFNWGNNSPSVLMDADTYSIRWIGQIQPMYSETYTFYTTGDDGIRLWINNQLIIDNWNDHAPTVNTGTISLTSGIKYDIKLEYYESSGGAQCVFEWSSASQSRQVVPQSQLYSDSGNGTGLVGMYFDNSDFTSSKLSRTDSSINFSWGNGSPDTLLAADTFSVRWVGKILPTYSQTYTFYTTSDDGIKLWVNNQLIINNWTDHGPTVNTGTISLTAGVKYDIKLEFYDNTGGATCQLEWSSTSQSRQIIPQTQLYSLGLDITNINNLVGICYSLWFDPVVRDGMPIYDITEIIKQAGQNKTAPVYGGYPAFHFWGKPALDYYNSSNATVIRTHMQQLAEAGVDFIILDNTNAKSYISPTDYDNLFRNAAQLLLDTVKQMRSEGLTTPYIYIWTGAESVDPDPAGTGRDIFNRYYTSGNYCDLFVYFNGKPFLNSTGTVPAELTNYFTVRKMSGLQQNLANGEWSFMNKYPQPIGVYNSVNEQISVSTAHQSSYMSDMYTATSRRGGTSFAQQWTRASSVRPKVVTITWWNEWIAQKLSTTDPLFTDNFNMEFSRDIEPLNGGHGSTYYDWMKAYIKEYKAGRNSPYGNVATVDLGDFETVTQGWKIGANTAAVNYVFSQQASYVPASNKGYCLLEASSDSIATGNVTKFITREYGIEDEFLDLSEYTTLKYSIGGWGGAPGATGYQTTIRIISSDGNQISKTVSLPNPAALQEISFDIESWTYRNTIRKIEIGYTALGCTVTWGGKFYVDNVRAETVGYNSGDFEYTTENWTADQNISSINTANSAYAFGIPAAYNGNKTLEVVMANTQGQSQRWIKKEFSTPMNFSQFNSFKFAFSAWKGAPGATSYTLYVRFTSKGGETLYQEISFPGDYNPMQQFSIDLTNWVYKNAITKIQIGYSANGSTQTWGGKFFIDNAKFTK